MPEEVNTEQTKAAKKETIPELNDDQPQTGCPAWSPTNQNKSQR